MAKKKKIGYAVVLSCMTGQIRILNNKIHDSRRSAQNAIDCQGSSFSGEIKKIYLEQ